MVRLEHQAPMRRAAAPTILAAAYVVAAGFVHLREWLGGYRDIPPDVPGSAVVRLGFPVQVGFSLALALALVVTLLGARRLAPWAAATTILFEACSLAALIASRYGTLLGWREPVWTRGASQSLAVAIGALAMLTAALVIQTLERRRPVGPTATVAA
jgi:hypothetical protein